MVSIAGGFYNRALICFYGINDSITKDVGTIPKLKLKYTSRWGADPGQSSWLGHLSMSRTRDGARSECSESSQESVGREDRHMYSRIAFREYIQGCVERFLATERNSLSVKPYKRVANYFVGRMLGEGTFGIYEVKLAIHVLAGVKVRLSAYVIVKS